MEIVRIYSSDLTDWEFVAEFLIEFISRRSSCVAPYLLPQDDLLRTLDIEE